MTTKLIKCDEVEISDKRQRRVFDEAQLRELADSIENKGIGLLHPIVLRQVGDKFRLVAGERRLRAFKDSHELGVSVWHAGQQVPTGMIPYVNLGEMDQLDAWEAELEENIRRTDLTWQERAQATEELFRLRTQRAERDGLPPPTVADIAEERTGHSHGGYQVRTRQEIILANHLGDSDVAAAPDLKTAMKVLKRKEETRRNEQIAATVGKTFTSATHQLFNTNAAVWLRQCLASQFDVILTDPPYGVGADEFGDSGGKAAGAHGYDDSPDLIIDMMDWLPAELFRVAKPQAHLYLFCDLGWFKDLSLAFSGAGWKVFRTPIIWHKPSGFRAPWPEEGPQRRYETCLYATKGNKRTIKMGGDVITLNPDENLGHAAQKPVALYRELLSRSVIAGDKVFDPYCGTGPIFPAAHEFKCQATGIDIDPAAFGIAATRIKELT